MIFVKSVSILSQLLTLDLRIHTKGLIPELKCEFEVPQSITPSKINSLTLTNLTETPRTHRLCFTIRNLLYPILLIRILINDKVVMERKVILPLVDFFDKVQPNGELFENLWRKLRFEKRDVNVVDSLWVSDLDCIMIKDHIARATNKNLFDLLPSVQKISTIV